MTTCPYCPTLPTGTPCPSCGQLAGMPRAIRPLDPEHPRCMTIGCWGRALWLGGPCESCLADARERERSRMEVRR